jgi:hypothetical protein
MVKSAVTKAGKQKKNRKNSQRELLALNSAGNSLSGRIQDTSRTFDQSFPMVKANVNVSTGAVTYNNPTASATFFGSASGNVTTDPCFACFFTLGDMPQQSTFTALFDQYKINTITATFLPTSMPSTALYSSANMLNQPDTSIWYTVDLDDASVVSPLTALMEYEGAQRVAFTGKPFKVRWVPHVANAAYSGTFTSYANVKSPWIDCASNGVQHYGLKWAMSCPINATFATPTYSLTITYNVSFRGVR